MAKQDYVVVQGVRLGPFETLFLNEDAVRKFLESAYVSCEEIMFHKFMGCVSWPGGLAYIGERLAVRRNFRHRVKVLKKGFKRRL